jgi:hypothetical protein
MVFVSLIVALIMPVLFTTTEIAHAAENRYGMTAAPPNNATMVALTAYSGDESYVLTVTRIRRVVASETGTTAVAYDMGAFHSLDGPENVLVESPLADVVVSTRGVRWVEFPAHLDTEPPLAIPSPAERSPVAVCYRIRAAGAVAAQVVETTDAFGTQRLVIGRPETLCVPSSVAFPGDPYFYYPAYGRDFPPAPLWPVRLCFKVRPEKPALRPPVAAVATYFGSAVAALEPIKEHCVEATITPEAQEAH